MATRETSRAAAASQQTPTGDIGVVGATGVPGTSDAPSPINPADPTAPTAADIANGLVLGIDGDPFPVQRLADARMVELGLSRAEWESAPYGDGFAIQRRLAKLSPSSGAEPVLWVKFHAKGNPMDPDEVVLAVNGETLIIRREQRVPVPQRFLEVADHAQFNKYSLEPDKDRKVSAVIRKYPYDNLGMASAADFSRYRRQGTKANRDYAVRQGIALEG